MRKPNQTARTVAARTTLEMPSSAAAGGATSSVYRTPARHQAAGGVVVGDLHRVDLAPHWLQQLRSRHRAPVAAEPSLLDLHAKRTQLASKQACTLQHTRAHTERNGFIAEQSAATGALVLRLRRQASDPVAALDIRRLYL